MILYVDNYVYSITDPFCNKIWRKPFVCEPGNAAAANMTDTYKFNYGSFTYSDHLISKPFRIIKEKSINRVSWCALQLCQEMLKDSKQKNFFELMHLLELKEY